MATMMSKQSKLSFEQVLKAVRQLSPVEQSRLSQELTKRNQVFLVSPDPSAEAVQKGCRLAEEVRAELKTMEAGSLEETMTALRGRSW